MNARKYVLCFAVVLYSFLAANLVLWHGTVKHMFRQRDLNRLGYFEATEALTQPENYSVHHTEMRNYLNVGIKESFDIITIGDSFTNGGGEAYYQDYLADKYGIKALNFRLKNHCLTDLYILLTSGLLDELHPKVIIIESVGRSVQGRLGTELVSIQETSRKEVEHRLLNKSTSGVKASTGIIPSVMIETNIGFLYSMALRIINPERLSPEVYITELDRELFTNLGYESTLLFYFEDLNYIDTPLNAEMINRNLNTASAILSEKGIKLIFMPCVDKYDLYYPYIKDKNGRPENPLFTEMRKVQDKEYTFIDTKAILQEALERGEKDIYWFGDTHWSWKGAELVCDELVKYICP